MRKVQSRLLVVDADVARACGGSDRSPAPQVLRALEAILTICHRVLVTPELLDEWTRHAGRNQAFQRWRRQMHGRKKIVRGSLKQLVPLADRLAHFAGNEEEAAQVRKDAHLIAAALEQALPVISLDDRMRRFLVRCLGTVPHLERITWVNPLHPEEELLAWLERGALDEPERQLPAHSREEPAPGRRRTRARASTLPSR